MPSLPDVNTFGFDLFGQLRKNPGNLAICPPGIALALGMASCGARGETAAQILRVLHMEGTPEESLGDATRRFRAWAAAEPAIRIRSANRLFGEKRWSFRRSFTERLHALFDATSESLDFRNAPDACREHVNRWVEAQTENRIRDLIARDAVSPDTRMILVAAMYFYGRWAVPFEESLTRPAQFRISPHRAKRVQTMETSGMMRFGRGEGFSAIAIPYLGGEISMWILLPDAIEGLAAVEASLDARTLAALVAGAGLLEAKLFLPRFTVDSGSGSLNDALSALGMPLAFERGAADFTGIAETPDPAHRPSLDRVIHRVLVDVHELGTEAAAVAASMFSLGAPPQPIDFRVDHSFLFFVRVELGGLVLFMGRVADPD